MDENKFRQQIVSTLAKRAACRCSNPDCGAITSGPADDINSAVNVGQAAHIYGAKKGSARFDPSMTPAERSDISNAIWLCGNCHKLIDDNPSRYPAGLLFEWQRAHELKISEQVGKAGAEMRHRYEKRHLEEFGRISYLAERILIEKAEFWEYKLTAEVLRFEMNPVLRRWEALKRGLYVREVKRIQRDDFLGWLRIKTDEVLAIFAAFNGILNSEFAKAWGEDGVPGDDVGIVSTCRLCVELCYSALHWEEEVRFISLDGIFDEVIKSYAGVAGIVIGQAAKVPEFLSDIFALGNPESGEYRLSLEVALPDGWVESISAALDRAKNRM